MFCFVLIAKAFNNERILNWPSRKLELFFGTWVMTNYSAWLCQDWCLNVFKHLSWGRDIRAYIAALRQAKFYPLSELRQLQIVHCGCCNAQSAAAMHQLRKQQILHCCNRNARAAMHEMECSVGRAFRQLFIISLTTTLEVRNVDG